MAIKFELPNLPEGAIVTSAELSLYREAHDSAYGDLAPYSAFATTTDWLDTEANWYTPGEAIELPAVDVQEYEAKVIDIWQTYDVTESIKNMYSGTSLNFGFILTAGTDSVTPQHAQKAVMSSSENATISNRPKLTITF